MRIRYLRRPVSSRVCWWIDLDNTLHDASLHILPEIDVSMTRYVSDVVGLEEAQASRLRTHYWLKYGATLLGMIRHHGVEASDFLHRTHTLPNLGQQVVPNPRMRSMLARLPGQRILLTNAPADYAIRVMQHLGIQRHFHGVLAIDDMWIHGRLQPKPAALLWAHLKRCAPARRHVLFEDTLGHLKSVRRQRMGTVWVAPKPAPGRRAVGRPAFVDSKVRHFAHAGAWALRVAQTGQAGSRGTVRA